MPKKGLIIVALLFFLGLITFPIWYNLASGPAAQMPELAMPVGETECVAETSYMRASHMDLLIDWREKVARENVREFQAASGRTFEMSLTGTCLKQCHTSKTDFCDRCHNYSGVSTPYCWDCHIDPQNTDYATRQVVQR